MYAREWQAVAVVEASCVFAVRVAAVAVAVRVVRSSARQTNGALEQFS